MSKVDPSQLPNGEEMEGDGDYGTPDQHSGYPAPGEMPNGEEMAGDGDFGTPGTDEGFEPEQPEHG